MSDTQRDREERQHVIEVLQNIVDWMEAANYIVATPERRHALLYAIASIKTDLRYDLLYEETSEQADKQADKPTTKNDCETCIHNKGVLECDMYGCEYEPTTKNNSGVDWESYKDLDGNSLDDLILEVLQNNFDCGNTYGYKVADEIIGLLPSVTPIRPKGHWIVEKGGSYPRNGCCSNCKDFHTNDWNIMNYCPNCGSDNREVEE